MGETGRVGEEGRREWVVGEWREGLRGGGGSVIVEVMKLSRKSLFFCWGVLVVGWAGAVQESEPYTPAPFARYQPILDRMPFGALPESFDPEAALEAEAQKTAEQEKMEQRQVANQLGFSALNITPKGTIAVGFTDRSINPPENHYLQVGQSANGWTVLKANYKEDWAKFEKDGVVIAMHLTKGMIDDPDAAKTNGVGSAHSGDALVAHGAHGGEAPTVRAAPALAAKRSAGAVATGARDIPGLVRRPGISRARTTTAAAEGVAKNGKDAVPPRSFAERLRERTAREEAQKAAADKATLENLQNLARQVAQDELAKRDEEAARGVEELRLQQVLFAAQQEEQAAAEAAELEAALREQQIIEEEQAAQGQIPQ